MRAPDGGDAPRAAPPWTHWPLGCRVVLRRRLPEGGFTDALGDLVQADDVRAVVRTRRGDVTVEAADVVAAKRVPPAPVRRARPSLADDD